jgi:hypothetical protein
MNQSEIQERNKLIALMLGWEESSLPGIWNKKDNFANYVVYSEHNNYPHRGLPFHRDWNWLMEAVEFVEKMYNNQPIYFGHNNCVIFSPKTIKSKGKDKKEAVFIAVSDFAQKFNNKEI